MLLGTYAILVTFVFIVKKYLSGIVGCALLGSCSGIDRTSIEPTYEPSKMHAPFFSERSQVQFEASISEWYHLACGYSVTDNIAIVSSVRFMNPSESDSNFHQNRFFDLGAGYFFTKNFFRSEAYIRIGKGYTNIIDQYDRQSYETDDTAFSLGAFSYDYTQYSIQLNLGIEWEQMLLGASVRGGYMHLQNVRREVRTPPESPVTLLNFTDSRGSTNLDFGVTVRYKPVSELGLELQMVLGEMSEVIGFDDPRFAAGRLHGKFGFGLTLKF